MTRKRIERLQGRRRALSWIAYAFAAPCVGADRVTSHRSPVTPYAPVLPGHRLRFPEDEGSHPAFRTEWWYITGWLQPRGRAPIGFQVTFFRTRPQIDERNPSLFAARQIIIAHAALSDAGHGRLVHDEKLARAAFGLVGATEKRMHVWVDDWSLEHEGGPSYRVRIPAREFAMDFRFSARQPPLMQGDEGYSRKGPRPESASYYYSIPHLQVEGKLIQGGKRGPVSGTAWLDHEWSSSYMDERASGWDWIGINFSDGSALMAFRMRERTGGTLWAGGTYRSADGRRKAFAPAEVEMLPMRSWRSPRTGASYPVAWRVRAGDLEIAIDPLMDDQEYDTRASVGTIYWEGAVTASQSGKAVGRGYLELTGYWQPMKL